MKIEFKGIPVLLFLLVACSSSRKLPAASPQVVSPAKDTTGIGKGEPEKPVRNIKTDVLLEDLLKAYPQYFDMLLPRRAELKIQIIYTQIDRQANNQPVFKTYYFN